MTDRSPADPVAASEVRLPGMDVPEIEVRRSRRRRRTVSAYRDGDRVVVLMPAHITRAEEREWIRVMLERLEARERRRRPSDEELLARSRTLRRRFLAELDDDRAPTSVRWVANQGSRWGSCTPADRTVRLSTRLQGMPRWVIDYVLLHELVHLLEPGHTEQFWTWLNRYPWTERARGYLEGVAATADLSISELADAEQPGAGEPGAGEPGAGVGEEDVAEFGASGGGESGDGESGDRGGDTEEGTDEVEAGNAGSGSRSTSVSAELPLFE